MINTVMKLHQAVQKRYPAAKGATKGDGDRPRGRGNAEGGRDLEREVWREDTEAQPSDVMNDRDMRSHHIPDHTAGHDQENVRGAAAGTRISRMTPNTHRIWT